MVNMVTVTWQSHISSRGNIPEQPKIFQSIGFVIKESEQLIVLSQSFEQLSNNQIQVEDCLSIPKRSILHSIQLEIIAPQVSEEKNEAPKKRGRKPKNVTEFLKDEEINTQELESEK